MIEVGNLLKAVSDGLVSEKSFKDYPDLKMFKYKKKVFYKNLWDDTLVESRGLVLDKNNQIVTLPFRKVFNYLENGTTMPKKSVVKIVEKKNGFFAAASLHNGEVLVSTTGSLVSDFTKMAKDKLNLDAVKLGIVGMNDTLRLKGTMLFEIVHENDPHIVQEEVGAYLIGFRCHESGMLVPEEVLDRIAYACNTEIGEEVFKRPHHEYCTFKTALRKVKECKHEGYMVYRKGTDEALKLKSPYYLTKKFLMRMGTAKVELLFDNYEKLKETVDEEFYGVLEYIAKSFDKETWLGYTDQERRVFIEGYLYGK